MNRPTFIIVAGVNGAGKTTLYTDNHELFTNTRRINADEILQQQDGDWNNTADNLRSMREELREIHDALGQGTSIHMETTLAGNGYALKKIIAEAHANNYEISLLYVTVSSPQVAIQRVKSRVAKGGHGVSGKSSGFGHNDHLQIVKQGNKIKYKYTWSPKVKYSAWFYKK